MVTGNLAGWLEMVVVCCQNLVNIFLVDVGTGGMVCACSCLDSEDRFLEHVTRLNSAATRAIWLWP